MADVVAPPTVATWSVAPKRRAISAAPATAIAAPSDPSVPTTIERNT
jgi:hypothetical protein